MKKLPEWKLLLHNFPNKSAGEVFTEIGGKVKLNYDIGVFNNACATREKPVANSDGSVDVYFGPKAPAGKEKNWVPTNPDKGFFLVFRFYGPLEGYIDKTWVLNDLELLK